MIFLPAIIPQMLMGETRMEKISFIIIISLQALKTVTAMKHQKSQMLQS